MKKVITTEKIPIKLWLDDMEEGALTQAENIANLPFAFKHIAIMPDSHQGYGMPIGAVLATKGVVVPNAVGVDIGCGMCAVKTNLKSIETHELETIIGKGYQEIPVGFNQHKSNQMFAMGGIGSINSLDKNTITRKNEDKAAKQLGTLGGGNHFIEIQKGNDGHIWVMIHSGSRKLGHTVATFYNKLAKKLNQEHFSIVSPDIDMAFLRIESKEGKSYLAEMNACIDYALANRTLMMHRMTVIMEDVTGQQVDYLEFLNKSHNLATWENHYGSNVLVHRKGATQAKEGELGMIPGTQGTNSYIVRGKGNKESFNSCSHGAGRALGRKQAIKNLNLKTELAKMESVVHNMKTVEQLDEAPSAYKDIKDVMANQTDLVDVVVELTPLAVIKG